MMPCLFVQTCPVPAVDSNSDSTLPCGGRGVCLPASGTCSCFKGYRGAACGDCENDYQNYTARGSCIKVPVPTCLDNVWNGLEFGIDCGQFGGCRRCGANDIELPKVGRP